MREVAIVGVGQVPVAEHWSSSLRQLAADAVAATLEDAPGIAPEALIVGNAFGATFNSQSQLGALIADYSGLGRIESWVVEAADASGGAALRAGYLAVASGAVDSVLVLGVEKSSDSLAGSRVAARNVALDADFESAHGVTIAAQAALLMRRYMYEYGVELDTFEGFSINAHANGKSNKNAMFRNALKQGAFAKASMVADPVNLFDVAPDGDGAAGLLLVSADKASGHGAQPILIAGSGASTDQFALHERSDFLDLVAVRESTRKALAQSNLELADIDLFEAHDAYTILTALALEATGFAERGEGWKWAQDSGAQIRPNGRLPISTFGGLKSRGNPAGATGVYQAVEAVLQLRGQAGAVQVPDARTALIQSIGGIGSTVVTHVLQQMN
jgi:acetyl-CoA C-acetyltransferase